MGITGSKRKPLDGVSGKPGKNIKRISRKKTDPNSIQEGVPCTGTARNNLSEGLRVMEFPKEPVRSPVKGKKGTRGKRHGLFPSRKMGRLVDAESRLERFQALLFEVDCQVTKFIEQPFILEYEMLGKKRVYTPDFAVIINGEYWVVEVKPSRHMQKAVLREKYRVVSRMLSEKGWRFCVRTEKEICSEPRLDNAKLIFRGMSPSYDSHVRDIEDAFRNNRCLSMQELCKRIGGEYPFVTVAAGFRHCLIRTDMSVKLSPDSIMEYVK